MKFQIVLALILLLFVSQINTLDTKLQRNLQELENTDSDIEGEEIEGEDFLEGEEIYEGEEDELCDKVITVYWCGFDDEFCGDSTSNDVYEYATHVIIAYLNIEETGAVYDGEMPVDLIKEWHEAGKKVLISVGGRSGLWSNIYQDGEDGESYDMFITSLIDIVNTYNLDGVDLQSLTYFASPAMFLSLMEDVKAELNEEQILIVSLMNVAVYPSAQVPMQGLYDENQAWNYFVPIVQSGTDAYDFVQVQIYQNDYLGQENGSAEFFIHNVLGWLNIYSEYTIPDFEGVDMKKLIISLISSEDAGDEEYFVSPENLKEAILRLRAEKINIAGINLWNSYFDYLNDFALSKAAFETIGCLEGFEGEEIEGEEYEGEDFLPEGEDSLEGEDIYEGEEDDECEKILTIYWCGFDEEFCGDSSSNDVYEEASHVIIAYLNIEETGAVYDGEMPVDLIKEWHEAGKKVLISVGGRSGLWSNIYQDGEDGESYDLFITSLIDIVNTYNLDGVDLQTLTYYASPAMFLSLMEDVKAELNEDQILIVSLVNVAVYPSELVPIQGLYEENQAWNYFVPIVQSGTDAYDYVQVQIYQNNDYLNAINGSGEFFVLNVLGWLNKYPGYTIPDFAGVEDKKLIISILASEDAGTDEYFVSAENLMEAFENLRSQNIKIAGINLWNSHYDYLNDFALSKAAFENLFCLEEFEGEEYEGEEFEGEEIDFDKVMDEDNEENLAIDDIIDEIVDEDGDLIDESIDANVQKFGIAALAALLALVAMI
ncbi:Glycoside hydrolase, superfamily [Pseudocohnilembus persalinus]|uniref:Glycoside hydrolase, superfamily n=1 Tax=Pseudocohnilembus persalinus TaxID=266149 RepID=A0A0V0R5D8_PSEPJ|nr:Glycoside hydrolase, superfamily [Pseudocohnilembus persalinus]|eukprot:KRX09699.1 Glycoside hydrolase, superfamily [Pseudocohnilembus persalinus]